MKDLFRIWLLLGTCLLSIGINAQEIGDIEGIFRPNKTPIWDYTFLRNTTKEFLETAKGLERDLLAYKDRLAEINERTLLLNQAIGIAERNVDLAQIGIDYSNQAYLISQRNADIAQTRVLNKVDQINEAAGTLEFMKKKHDEIASGDFLSIIGSGIATVAGAVISFFAPPIGVPMLVGGIGGLAGGIGSEIKSDRDIEDRDAITERQTQDQINQMGRELIELQQLASLSQQQIRLDSIATEKAEDEKGLAEEQRDNAVENLEQFKRDVPIDSAKAEEIISEIRLILSRYIQYSVVLAQMTEKSYQAEEVIRSNYIKTFSEYVDSDGTLWLAADRILFDLNTMEFNRITQKRQKPNFSTYTLSLRNKDPFQMERLRQTGRMNFDITQFELDLAYPGTYARTIKRINVQVVALAEPGSIKGQLTKEGLSWKKVPKEIAGEGESAYTLDDWLKYLPSEYASMVFVDEDETLIFPRAQGISQTPGLFDVLEGKPLCGTFTLDLPKYANQFDYSSLADVIITIDFASYYDPVYKTLVESEICEQANNEEFINGRELQLSMRFNQPDDWYEFRNPIEADTFSHKRRYFPIIVQRGFVPPNHIKPYVNSLAVGLLTESGYADVNVSVTSLAMNQHLDLLDNNGLLDYAKLDTLPMSLRDSTNGDSIVWLDDFQPVVGRFIETLSVDDVIDTVFLQVADSMDLAAKNTYIPQSYDEPFEIWIIKFEADQNPAFAEEDGQRFDEEKLADILDIQMNLGYRFSSNFCEFSRRRYAWMDVDGDTTIRGIDARQHEVPFLYVIDKGRETKKVQSYLSWYNWKTVQKQERGEMSIPGYFVLNKFIHKTEYADLTFFHSFVGPKTYLEEVEVAFDLKNPGDVTTLYCEPAWISIRARKLNSQQIELRFEVDQAAVPRDLNPEGVTLKQTAPVIFNSNAAYLKFRYLVVPTGSRHGTLNISIGQYDEDDDKWVYSDNVLERGAVFRAYRQDFQTNFTLRVHREDYPNPGDQPSFILRNLEFYDLSRF